MSLLSINYASYFKEAVKITLLCLLITAFFVLAGARDKAVLITFNIAVISAAAIYKQGPKSPKNILLACLTITLSIVLGGTLGYYSPLLANLFLLLFAGLSFYLPTTKEQANILIQGTIMFLIFSFLTFPWQEGVEYLFDGVITSILFIIFYFILKDISSHSSENPIKQERQLITAIITILSLSMAWLVSYFLNKNYHLPNLYWIGLTILLVIQGSQQNTILTSVKRILVNIFGAFIAIFLFGYLLPADFWIDFFTLVLLLFLIFFMSFSYIGRVFFIELFVLGFAYMMGMFHNFLVIDRVLLTLIGGLIAIVMTIVSYK